MAPTSTSPEAANPRQGIRIVAPDGTTRQVAGDIDFPNGMVVTPD
jgi:sugar lactone lactonase YvrE